MNVLFFMIPTSILLGLLFMMAFIFAAKRGQFEDLKTPAIRILDEDDLRKDEST